MKEKWNEAREEGTGAVKMAITNLNGVDNEVSDLLLLHTPNSKPDHWHLEPTVKSYRHFFFYRSFVLSINSMGSSGSTKAELSCL